MKRLRLAALAAMSCCAVMLIGAGTASAQEEVPAFAKKMAVTGTKGFEGSYTINRFARRGNQLVAVGTLKGTVRKGGKDRRVTRRNVKMPVAVTGAGPAAQASQIPPTPGACQVLNLVLGPIDLNLLGLRVRTNEIRALIEGIPGGTAGGGLVGSLLCAVANLLNPSGALGPLTTALNDLVAALNGILGILESLPGASAARASG
jgi:hypothetical protein